MLDFSSSHVFQPGLVFLCVLAFQHIHIPGSDEQLVVEVRQAHAVLQKLRHALDERGKACIIFMAAFSSGA